MDKLFYEECFDERLKYGFAALLFAIVGLFLVACSNDSSSSDSDSNKDDSSFTYAISGDPASTNPINASDRWGLTVSNIIYSPLVAIETDGTHKNVLAESVEPADDGLSVTVKLKQDVKWSDGKHLPRTMLFYLYTES